MPINAGHAINSPAASHAANPPPLPRSGESSRADTLPPLGRPPDGKAIAVHFAVLGALAVVLLVRSWRSWGDLVVDFPEELYVPWQLTEGRVLYRDIVHYYGPLSQYYHALLFWLFGPSYTVVLVSNFGFVLADTLLLYMIFAPWSGLAAFSAGLCFLGFHAFQHTSPVGNYNFMAPYCHEAVHGTFIWLSAIWALLAAQRTQGPRYLYLFGFLWGVSALLKPEFPIAIGLMSLALWRQILRRDRLAAFALFALAPPAIATLAFSPAAPISAALRHTFGAFMPILESNITQNPLYVQFSGLGNTWSSFTFMAVRALTVLCLVMVWFAVDCVVARVRREWLRTVVTAVVVSGLTLAVYSAVNVSRIHVGWALVLPPLAAALLLTRRRRFVGEGAVSLLAFVLACGMAAFLPKVLLRPSVAGFGFYLALPLTMAMVFLNVVIVPRAWHGVLGFSGRTYRLLAFGLFAAIILQIQESSAAYVADKSVAVGSRSDLIYGSPRMNLSVSATAVNQILGRIEQLAPRDSTLMVIPEGMMLNYLARRRNPTPYMADWVNRQLFESLGGPQTVIERIKEAPPDFIIFLFRVNEIRLPGYNISGPDGYARDVIAWITENYVRVEYAGANTDDFTRLGYQLWKARAGLGAVGAQSK